MRSPKQNAGMSRKSRGTPSRREEELKLEPIPLRFISTATEALQLTPSLNQDKERYPTRSRSQSSG